MKHLVTLAVSLAAVWLIWSGHSEPFLLFLGLISVAASVWIAHSMGIADEEGAPTGLSLRPLLYAVWLGKEIVIANIEVTKLILDRRLPIHPQVFCVAATQKTALGRVVFANSITLTPGTVSIDLVGDRVWVHALSYAGAEEDLSGDMSRRVCALER